MEIFADSRLGVDSSPVETLFEALKEVFGKSRLYTNLEVWEASRKGYTCIRFSLSLKHYRDTRFVFEIEIPLRYPSEYTIFLVGVITEPLDSSIYEPHLGKIASSVTTMCNKLGLHKRNAALLRL